MFAEVYGERAAKYAPCHPERSNEPGVATCAALANCWSAEHTAHLRRGGAATLDTLAKRLASPRKKRHLVLQLSTPLTHRQSPPTSCYPHRWNPCFTATGKLADLWLARALFFAAPALCACCSPPRAVAPVALRKVEKS